MTSSISRQHAYRFIATALVLGALWIPVIRTHDSFPLSTQPMYATARDGTETLVSAVGVTLSGEIERLSLPLIAQTDDPLIAESLLENAIRSGAADQLCEEIAGRVERDELATIEVVSEELDLVEWVQSKRLPFDRTVHASCNVAP